MVNPFKIVQKSELLIHYNMMALRVHLVRQINKLYFFDDL